MGWTVCYRPRTHPPLYLSTTTMSSLLSQVVISFLRMTSNFNFTTGYYNYPSVFTSEYSSMTGLPPMDPPTYSPRSMGPPMPPLRPVEPSPYSPRPQHGPDMVDLAPAAPWPCWSAEYQPPPPPGFASSVEAELALGKSTWS